MELDISKIRSKSGSEKSIDFIQPVEDIAEKKIHFLQPVHFKGKIRNLDGTLYLDGEADILIERVCDRCLCAYKQSLTIRIEENFCPENKIIDDIDFLKTYNGNQLVLDRSIQDCVLLNTNMNSICKEDCKGICPTCGKDLNEGPCSCEKDTIDPRMEILKNLVSEE
ncbi:DUF177 domain-containing protein [Clostridia bacterium]|nr:DUF177 domain-containing protein [Clostridia bacterium]